MAKGRFMLRLSKLLFLVLALAILVGPSLMLGARTAAAASHLPAASMPHEVARAGRVLVKPCLLLGHKRIAACPDLLSALVLPVDAMTAAGASRDWRDLLVPRAGDGPGVDVPPPRNAV